MTVTDFKRIHIVPSSKDLENICLSATQRKTPTVIHKSAPVGAQRKFYIRKVKACAQNFYDKLEQIIADFPTLETLHPFYENLLTALYGRNEYKSALGHLNFLRGKINAISKEYVKLIKFGDSQFRCKTLKRQALGKMVKLIRKKGTKSSLSYLEETRQHLSRFPSIDTATRTVIMAGCPNVGKSSFLNKISRADVEVQPYAFTTKSLFVGHSDYENLRWQFIDTPGLLDRSYNESSTAEQLAITALNYLDDAGVLFIIDISEQCGYFIEKQLELLTNVHSLFCTKPLIVVLNKTDVISVDSIDQQLRERIYGIIDGTGNKVPVLSMSTATESGVMNVRNTICDLVLRARVSRKIKKIDTDAISNRVYIANKIDNRTHSDIPEDVLALLNRASVNDSESKTLHLLRREQGDDFHYDLRTEWGRVKPDERGDVIPEIYNGHNISDFGYIANDALTKLRQEDTYLETSGFYNIKHDALPKETKELADKIREAEALKKLEGIEKKNITRVQSIGRKAAGISLSQVQQSMKKLGVDVPNDAKHLNLSRSRSKTRSISRKPVKIEPLRAESICRTDPARSRSRSGIRDENTFKKVTKIANKAQNPMNKLGKRGEADRHIGSKKPKHLFSGKRGVGKTDRR